jgi:hypothetical protein
MSRLAYSLELEFFGGKRAPGGILDHMKTGVRDEK